ncbi:hypothetical protein ACMA1D_30130 [Streptomyces sp. 796.1]|uniref:hypothetical protein n=1 Tax=Streptomyces sp. 796.1 TaxID=3163029 RepID=UPI0039C8C321
MPSHNVPPRVPSRKRLRPTGPAPAAGTGPHPTTSCDTPGRCDTSGPRGTTGITSTTGSGAPGRAAARRAAPVRHRAPTPRTRPALAIGVGALVAVGVFAVAPGASAVGGGPAAGAVRRVVAAAPECGDASQSKFPIGTRLRAGPDAYRAGGDWRPWRLELHNTTRVACAAIHPVLLFADRGRALRPDQVRVEFHDPYERRWRAVRFEATDEDENVGVFDGGGRGRAPRFKGFVVPAGKTVTVRARVRFTADAPTGPASAAVTTMQRQYEDGDWVGQSGTYRFTVEPPRAGDDSRDDGDADADGPGRAPERGQDPAAPATKPGPGRAEPGTGSGVTDGDADAGGREAVGGGGSGTGPADSAAGRPADPGDEGSAGPPQLAATGPSALWGYAAGGLTLTLTGGLLVRRTRRSTG